MHEFVTYFLNHMPSKEEWVAFLLVNIVAYVAARNTVLRQQRQLEKKAYRGSRCKRANLYAKKRDL